METYTVALDTAGMSYFPGKGFYTKDIRRKFVWKKEGHYKITFFKNKGWGEKIMFVDFMYVENFFLHICVSFGQTMKLCILIYLIPRSNG